MIVTDCIKRTVSISEYEAHSHKGWEVVYNLTGNIVASIGDKDYAIASGDVMVIPPDTIHSGSSGVDCRDMFFKTDIMNFTDTVIIRDDDGNILTLLNMMHKMYTESSDKDSEPCNRLAEAICSLIKDKISSRNKYSFTKKIKNEIYHNLSNPDFDLAKAIKATGYNSDYFRRCYRADYGKSPLEYLTDLRIHQAKDLLVQDIFVTVEDVATLCGFADNFYFSTCFKKHTGMSPSQYRKVHR